jgi:hypothetical protein
VCSSELRIERVAQRIGEQRERRDERRHEDRRRGELPPVLMNPTTYSDIRTRITWLTLGRMCTNIRARWLVPIASAAFTYSRLLCLMYSARTSRYMPVQPTSPRIRMTVPMPRPSTAANAKISRMSGIDVKTL